MEQIGNGIKPGKVPSDTLRERERGLAGNVVDQLEQALNGAREIAEYGGRKEAVIRKVGQIRDAARFAGELAERIKILRESQR